jgi:glycosyltransferase involved in cell wall biosynthesis
MNIGILLPGFSSGENDAAIPVQLNLVREMARHHDVRVLATRYPHRRDVYPVHGATVHSLGAGQVRGVGRARLWLDTLRTLRRLHREKPFDVLHAMWADETGLLATWAGRLLGVPSVVSVAGGELVGFRELNYGLQLGTLNRWTVRQALQGADCVVVACEYIRRLLAGYRVKAVRKVVLGVDVEQFTPPSDSSVQRIVHVAGLYAWKDQTTLLKAFARLAEPHMLDIVGTGVDEARLKALAHELGIAARVNFVGAVAYNDMPLYYQRAALHVLSSRHEGLGMVTLEAAACAVPSISTAVGLLPDCPELGISVPVADDTALAQAITQLFLDETRRAALAASALKTVRERFTIQETVRQFTELYRELTN